MTFRVLENNRDGRRGIDMSFKRTLVVSIIMILSVILLDFVSRAENVQPNKPFSTFPKRIGEWTGEEERFDQRVYDLLGVDDSLLCNYQTPDGRQVQLYVGYYQSQREGDLIHSPRHCLPGAGWNIIHTSLDELVLPSTNPGKTKVIKLILQKGAQQQVVLYWFQARGRFIASEYLQKIYLVLDSITRHRTDEAFVRLIAPVLDGREERTLEYIKDFAALIIPVLQDYIPS